jgi:outer membrane murein-binding lipoprotein Lpp
MRSLILVIGLLAIAACSDDIEKKEVLPTAPRKVATAATRLAALKFDTTKASSVCKAAVRQSQRAQTRLVQTPGDLPGQRKIKMLDALMSDACR